jgi:hypothetical protein
MEQGKHICAQCHGTYKSPESLRKHRSIIHRNKTTKFCHICGKAIAVNNISTHIQLCSEIQVKKGLSPMKNDATLANKQKQQPQKPIAGSSNTQGHRQCNSFVHNAADGGSLKILEFKKFQKDFQLKEASVKLKRMSVDILELLPLRSKKAKKGLRISTQNKKNILKMSKFL